MSNLPDIISSSSSFREYRKPALLDNFPTTRRRHSHTKSSPERPRIPIVQLSPSSPPQISATFHQYRPNGRVTKLYEADDSLHPFWHRNLAQLNLKALSEAHLPSTREDPSEECAAANHLKKNLIKYFEQQRLDEAKDAEDLLARQEANKADRLRRWQERDANPQPSKQKSRKKKNK